MNYFRTSSSDEEISESIAIEDINSDEDNEYSDDCEEVDIEVEDDEEDSDQKTSKEKEKEEPRLKERSYTPTNLQRPRVKQAMVGDTAFHKSARKNKSKNSPRKLSGRQERPRSMISNNSKPLI